MTVSRPAPYRAARELWAVRQLVGFGFELPVRRFLQLTALLSGVGVLLSVAAGSMLLELGSQLLVAESADASTRLRVQEGLAALVVATATYVGVLDLARGSLTSLRVKVSESPLHGLWAALDVRRVEAVLAERGVGVMIRSMALAAFVAGAALQLARSGSSATSDTAMLAVSVGVFHASSVVGLALMHAGRRARAVSGRWAWSVPAALALLVGTVAARMVPDGVHAGGVRAQLLSFALGFDGERWLQVMAVAAVVPVALGIVVVVLGVVAAEPPSAPADALAGATRSVVRVGASTWRMVEVGTGAARRSTAVRRLVGAGIAVAAASVGWRLGGGGPLPGADQADRVLTVYAVFVAAVVSSTAVAVAGQNVTLGQLRFFWEQGVRPAVLYAATVAVAMRRAVPLQLAIVVLAVAAWGMFPWRAVVVVVAVVLGDFLVDSLFARPRTNEAQATADPAVAVASIGVLLVLGALSFWSGAATAAALVIVTLLIGGAGPWMFSSRLRRIAVVAP